MSMSEIVKKLQKAIDRQANQAKTSAYDTPAEVRRVDGDTVWVHIPGGIDETPVKRTIACSAGDTVQVRVSGGRAWIQGNATAPPTDDTTANIARSVATTAQTVAEAAEETAEAVNGIATSASNRATQAITLAEGIDDHFWSDSAGAHITEDTQEDYLDDPSAAGGNTLITSQGMAVRHGTTQLAAFTASGAQIGQASGAHTVIDTSGQTLYAENGTSQVASFNTSGIDIGLPTSVHAEISSSGFSVNTNASVNFYANSYGIEYRPTAANNGFKVKKDGTTSNVIISDQSQKGSSYETATAANGSIAFGGEAVYLDGGNLVYKQTVASGSYSFAHGKYAVAEGNEATAQGIGASAASTAQTAIGKYNTADNNDTYVLIIGNGTADNARSNALTVDWSGNVNAAGKLEATTPAHFETVNPESAMDSGLLNLMYDPACRKVSINFRATDSANIGTTADIFTIPATYRPSDTVRGQAIAFNSSGTPYVGQCSIAANGKLHQGATNAARQVSGVIEYTI